MSFTAVEVLKKKRDGEELTRDEIQFFVDSLVKKTIGHSQIGAMLMAMYIRKLSLKETIYLTKAMIYSGEVLHFDNFEKEILVDKHSTGGVGDKVSLVLAPALAACGLKVPMISGRGLGYTGGTLDKLESIPGRYSPVEYWKRLFVLKRLYKRAKEGFQVSISKEKMDGCLANAGCFICGATETLAPADSVLYQIRDVTSTVDYMPFIIASILSKKAAEGISIFLLDIKYGNGSFLKNKEEAKEFRDLTVKIAKELNLNTRTIISEMNIPLGKYVGNSLEVIESVKCLRYEVDNNLTKLVKVSGGVVLQAKGIVKTLEEGEMMIENKLKNKTALKCFEKMLVSQGVSVTNAADLCDGQYHKVLRKANHVTVLRSSDQGVITGVTALNVAKACWSMGSGRSTPDSQIDYSVGVVLLKSVGCHIEKNEPWLEIHHRNEKLESEILSLLEQSLTVETNPKTRKTYTEVNIIY